jgi:phosphoribosyl-ATP pyrophosphohydrolase
MSDFLYYLEDFIKKRKLSANTEESYVARLLSSGRDRCAQKFGEEAVELVIAAFADKKEVVMESADVIFHLMVLLNHCDVPFEDVMDELKLRSELNQKG